MLDIKSDEVAGPSDETKKPNPHSTLGWALFDLPAQGP